MQSSAIIFENPIKYQDALDFQYRLLEARQNDKISDCVLLLQHKPVVTIGNRGRENFLLKKIDEYKQIGIDVHKVERGGDVTFHGPGQWVLYPILHLGKKIADSHGYLYNLEEIAIRTLNNYSVKGFRREGKSGAWTDRGKIAAIGFRLKKWVSFHGMSFNVMNELDGFKTIIPCGLEGENITSLENYLGNKINMNDVGLQLLKNFSEICERDLNIYSEIDLLPDSLKGLNPPRF